MIELGNRDFEYLLIKRAQADDDDAFNELLSRHMSMIHMLASRLQTALYLHDELVQAGRIGFLQALRKYDAKYNTRLITYAVPWILGEMKSALRAHDSTTPTYVIDDFIEMSAKTNIEETTEYSLIRRIDLRMAYETLNTDDRKLLLLRYIQGKTQGETACLLKKSQGQISKAEKRILDSLQHQLL